MSAALWSDAGFEGLSQARLSDVNWALGSVGHKIYCQTVRLLADGRVGGYLHPNEKFWDLRKDCLVFMNESGLATTIFNQCQIDQAGRLRLTGPFVESPGLRHFLEETRPEHKISDEPEKFIIDRHGAGPRRRNLVFMGANEASLHQSWERNIADADRNWDVAVSFYGDPAKYPPPGPVEYSSRQPRVAKWIAVHRAMYEGSPFWDYERIMVIDDDIMTSWRDLNYFFELCRDFDMLLAQPSLRQGCYINHILTGQQEGSLIRFTSFVENMAPCFTRDALRQCIATAQEGVYGFGLDRLWPKILGLPRNKIGIVDAVAIDHTRPFGVNYNVEKAHEEEQVLFHKFGFGWPYDMREFGRINR